MSIETNKTIVRNFIEANTVTSIDELCATDFIAHLPSFPTPTDRVGFIEFASMLYKAFPDLNHTVEFQLAENNTVASCVTVRGTHQDIFQGIKATGNKVEFTDLIITRLEKGKAVELWAQFEILGLLTQLGVNIF